MIVATLVAKVLDRAGDKALDEGEGVMKRMRDFLARRFSDPEGDDEGMALARLEDAPDSPARTRALAALIDDRANAEPEFRRELEALLEEARGAGIEVETLSQEAIGDQNVQAANLIDSEVNVNFGNPTSGGKVRPDAE